MDLRDVQQLAFLLMNAEPSAYSGQAAHGAWAAICADVAAGLRKHKLVSDHQFDETMFLNACLTDEAYYLEGEEA